MQLLNWPFTDTRRQKNYYTTFRYYGFPENYIFHILSKLRTCKCTHGCIEVSWWLTYNPIIFMYVTVLWNCKRRLKNFHSVQLLGKCDPLTYHIWLNIPRSYKTWLKKFHLKNVMFSSTKIIQQCGREKTREGSLPWAIPFFVFFSLMRRK